jgi:hypothetical protein
VAGALAHAGHRSVPAMLIAAVEGSAIW